MFKIFKSDLKLKISEETSKKIAKIYKLKVSHKFYF